MGLDIGIDLLKEVFSNTAVFGNFWIYQLAILFGTLIIITRAWQDWGDLALPVITGWHLVGFHYNYIFFAVAGAVFVLNSLSLKMLVGGLTSVGESIVNLRKGISYKQRVRNVYESKLKRVRDDMEVERKIRPIRLEKEMRRRAKLLGSEMNLPMERENVNKMIGKGTKALWVDNMVVDKDNEENKFLKSIAKSLKKKKVKERSEE